MLFFKHSILFEMTFLKVRVFELTENIIFEIYCYNIKKYWKKLTFMINLMHRCRDSFVIDWMRSVANILKIHSKC
jgi:hypothetical protein